MTVQILTDNHSYSTAKLAISFLKSIFEENFQISLLEDCVSEKNNLKDYFELKKSQNCKVGLKNSDFFYILLFKNNSSFFNCYAETSSPNVALIQNSDWWI